MLRFDYFVQHNQHEMFYALLVLTNNWHLFPDASKVAFGATASEAYAYLIQNNQFTFSNDKRLMCLLRLYISLKFMGEKASGDSVCLFFTQHTDDAYIKIHRDTQSALIHTVDFELVVFFRQEAVTFLKGYVEIAEEFLAEKLCIDLEAFEPFSARIVIPIANRYNNILRTIPVKGYSSIYKNATVIYDKDSDCCLSNLPCLEEAVCSIIKD